jgi:ABC-type branched-subunit amino acid transport system ATPase component
MPATPRWRCLTKRFGELIAVNDVTFSVYQNDVHALIDPDV